MLVITHTINLKIKIMNNRNLLIGAGVLVVGYLLYTKSKKDELKKRLENMKANKRPLWEA
jgi:hypothetical protein